MLHDLSNLEKDLWEAADQLRANSSLPYNEYFMPVLGVIFLRHAANRFAAVTAEIAADQAAGRMQKRRVTKADYIRRRALWLPETARFDHILALPKGSNLGQAINDAMTAIEEDFEPLRGVLPKDYGRFGNPVLEDLLRIFNRESIRRAAGDVFGRIYEYFLMKFADVEAHDKGEFFTPPSLVQTIVNVIEPEHGIVFDPAAGSGGMFVQSSHFIERRGLDTAKRVVFFGQEKTGTTIRLAKMNLAVHGLEGDIREANTFYDDALTLVGRCDFVMANPPFNVDMVDAEKIEGDRRLPFGLPGVSKEKKVSNGNYLWISYFWSYLNDRGRAGFVMSSQASSAGHGEKLVRRKIVESGDVDVMIAIRSNFFYTRTVPCELWFFDRAKPDLYSSRSARGTKQLPSPSGRGAGGEGSEGGKGSKASPSPLNTRGNVLMLDARGIYRKVTRKIYDFSPEQLANLSAIVWLYRGQTERFLGLVQDYFGSICSECAAVPAAIAAFDEATQALVDDLAAFAKAMRGPLAEREEYKALRDALAELAETVAAYGGDRDKLLAALEKYRKTTCKTLPADNKAQHKARKALDPIAEELRGLVKQADLIYKLAVRAADILLNVLLSLRERAGNNAQPPVAREGANRPHAEREEYIVDRRAVGRLLKRLDDARKAAVEQLKLAGYFHRQVAWLQDRFPDARLVAVPGLVRVVGREEIEAADWSLTPGRYVGVAPPEPDEDFDFEEAIRDIHVELAGLNEEAAELARRIQENFEELGI